LLALQAWASILYRWEIAMPPAISAAAMIIANPKFMRPA